MTLTEKPPIMTPDFHNPEIITVSADKVACDGDGGPLGHPVVYLPIYAGKGFVDCPYCDRRYVKNGDATVGAH